MQERYWSASKLRLFHSEVESIAYVFDTLSTESHLLSDYHLAILEQLSGDPRQSLCFADLLARVRSANDIEDEDDFVSSITTALDQLIEKTLVDKAFDPE